jgi:hypothetical protein
VKRQVVAIVLSSVCASTVWATDLKVRNVRLVDAGHVTTIVGTVTNTSDHLVSGGYLDIEVSKKDKVVARETVEVPDLEAGQAWRIAQPVQYGDDTTNVAVRARDANISITAEVVPYPGTVVAQ